LGAANATADSSDKRIAIDTDIMRDIGAAYTVCCSHAIQIEGRFVRMSIAIPKINSSA